MNRSIDSFLSNRSYFDKEDNVVTRNSTSTRDFTEGYSLGRNVYDYAEYIQEADGDEDIDKLSTELDSAMNEINNAKDESSNEPETEDTPDVRKIIFQKLVELKLVLLLPRVTNQKFQMVMLKNCQTLECMVEMIFPIISMIRKRQVD